MPRVSAQHQSDRRNEILEAAQRCFVRSGFHHASMQDICAEAGMSPGKLYRYFPSKEAIIAGYHGLFTGPAIERLKAANVREIVVTDSIPIPEAKRLPNMSILPVAPLLGDAIGRIHSGQSVGALFQ